MKLPTTTITTMLIHQDVTYLRLRNKDFIPVAPASILVIFTAIECKILYGLRVLPHNISQCICTATKQQRTKTQALVKA